MTKRLRLMGLVTLSTMVSVTSAHANVVAEWSALAVQCIAVGAPPLAPSRPGPPGLLDLALVHVAMHDAIQAIEGRYEPYLATPTATGHESVAVGGGRRRPSSAFTEGVSDLPSVPGCSLQALSRWGDPGLQVGFAAGDALIAEYRTALPPPFTNGTNPGEWRPTPPGI